MCEWETIPQKKACDGVNDCVDNSDELCCVVEMTPAFKLPSAFF